MFKQINIKRIIITIIGLIVIWFIFLRTKELSITYDGVETMTTGGSGIAMNKMARNASFKSAINETAPAYANIMSADSLYSESKIEDAELEEQGSQVSQERYRENRYYRVDTESFEYLIDELTKLIKDLDGTIKINEQNSNKKVAYDKEFYPRYQNLEFTVDNSVTDLEKIESTLKLWGNIRVANTNMTSIEQELTNYEQQLKEMEEARKALKESKDQDWIARQDADLAKRSERIKNQIENAKKQSTYKTYTINIYEVIKFRVNVLKYWYENNYSLQNAISNVLPDMIGLLARLIPIALALILILSFIFSFIRNHKKKDFEERIKIIKEEFNVKDIHFDIKM